MPFYMKASFLLILIILIINIAKFSIYDPNLDRVNNDTSIENDDNLFAEDRFVENLFTDNKALSYFEYENLQKKSIKSCLKYFERLKQIQKEEILVQAKNKVLKEFIDKSTGSCSQTLLPFGGKKVVFEKEMKNYDLSINLLIFQEDIAWVQFFCDFDREHWDKVKGDVYKVWDGYVIEKKYDFYYTPVVVYNYLFRDVMKQLTYMRAKSLGSLKEVYIPKNLKHYYDYLMSPFSSITYGYVCGYVATVPFGRIAIHKLIKNKRPDLIKNVLRGYSKGGRVYAIYALYLLSENGSPMSDEDKRAIQILSKKNEAIETCSGCYLNRESLIDVINQIRYRTKYIRLKQNMDLIGDLY